jgi:hypothetical protein
MALARGDVVSTIASFFVAFLMNDGPGGHAATSSTPSVHLAESCESLGAGHDGFRLPTVDSKLPRRDSRRGSRCNKGRIPGSGTP